MSLEWLAILLVFALLLLWFLGPRIIIDESVRSVQLPKDLNHYLNQSESRFSNIREGLNKEILWVNAEEKQTEYSIVYLHGFSASRQEISPVMEKVANALGANLFFTRLSGHGQTTEALSESTPHEWFQDATEALEIGKRLGEKVILVGTSTGATLALWLALKHQRENIHALLLLSPNLGLRTPLSVLALGPWGNTLATLAAGKTVEFKTLNEKHQHAWTNRYSSKVGILMLNMVRHICSYDFGQIKVPAFFIYSPYDSVVHPRKIEKFFKQLGSSQKKLLAILDSESESQHVITGDIISPSTNERVIRQMLQFLRPLC